MSSEMDQKTKIIPVMFDGDLVEVPAGTDLTIQYRQYGKNNNFRGQGYNGFNGN